VPTIYLETTIPSYLVAKSSRDIVILAHQQLTREWWNSHRHLYEIFISQVVLDEIRIGDREMVDKRTEVLQGIPMLELNSEVESLAVRYFESLQFPVKAIRDAFHLSYTGCSPQGEKQKGCKSLIFIGFYVEQEVFSS